MSAIHSCAGLWDSSSTQEKFLFRLFHLILVELSNLKNNYSPCFFPNLHRLLRLPQCSKHSHLCSACFPPSWMSLLRAESTCSLMLVPLPVWCSAGLAGIRSGVAVAGHTVMRAWGCIFSCELHFVVTEHGDRTANYTLLFLFWSGLIWTLKKFFIFSQDDFFSLQMGNFVLWVKLHWLQAGFSLGQMGSFPYLFTHKKLSLCKCSWKGHKK